MAHVLYNDKLIISYAEFNNETQTWSVRVDISWRLPHQRQFTNKAEAESYGLEIGKQWIDRQSADDPQ